MRILFPFSPMTILSRLSHALYPGILFILLLTTACQVETFTPPRIITATAQSQLTPTLTPTPFISTAPTPTAAPLATSEAIPDVRHNPALTVWINETSPAHKQVLQTITDQFSQAHHIDVEWRVVAPALMPELMQTAVLSDQFPIPDVVIHSLEQTMGWADQDLLNLEATQAILDQLGRDTFDPGALDLVTVDGQTAAVPVHGYHQLLIYRADWFEQQGLAPPDNYDAMITAAEAFFSRENLTSGFVVPTESNLVTTHQVFEHLALANGCTLIDEKGEVQLVQPACRDALDFYFDIIHQYSPSGVQTDSSARTAYLAGRTSIIMASPSMLPLLAGLDETLPPTCAQCLTNPAYLAENSGIITHITGRHQTAVSANFGHLTYMGITQAADADLALTFARFWFNEGYSTWLSIAPETKVPMRWGTADQPRQFIDNWGIIPLHNTTLSLTDLYGDAVVVQLRDNIASPHRWGFPQDQGALMSDIYESLTLSIVLQEMLSGYFNSQQTIFEAYNRVIGLIPNYEYTIEPTPEN